MEEKKAIVKYHDKCKVSFTISQEVHDNFQIMCKQLGIKMSPRIELLMKKDTQNMKMLLEKDEVGGINDE